MNKKRILTILTIVISALLGAGVWWLFSTNRLTFTINPGLQATSSAVCGTDVVDTYNRVASLEVRNGSSESVIDTEGMKSLANQIRGKDAYKTDATCQTLLFWTAFYENNFDSAVSAHTAIKSLHDKGAFADSNIRSAAPLSSYQSYLTSLSEVEVQGGN